MGKKQLIIFIMAIGAYTYYCYNNMMSFGLQETTGNITYGVFVVFCLEILLFFAQPKVESNSMRLNWILYIFWILACAILGNVPFGPNILHTLFPVISFLLFYRFCYNNDALKLCIGGFNVLFVILSGLYLYVIKINGILVSNTITGQSNLIYWPFMLIPFILLLEDKWYKIALMFIATSLTLLSLKRGAIISITIIWFFYLKSISAKTNKQKWIMLFTVFFAFISIFSYLQLYTDAALDRLGTMKEDEGSGRIEIWEKTYRLLANNSLSDWFIGKGEGSIFKFVGTSAHNDYLQMLFQYGLIGLYFIISFVLNTIKRYFNCINNIVDFKTSYLSTLIIIITISTISELWVSYSYFSFITAYLGCIEGSLDRKECSANINI